MGNCYSLHSFNSLILLLENSDIYLYYSFILWVSLPHNIQSPLYLLHGFLQQQNNYKLNLSICVIPIQENCKSCWPPQSTKVQLWGVLHRYILWQPCNKHIQVQSNHLEHTKHALIHLCSRLYNVERLTDNLHKYKIFFSSTLGGHLCVKCKHLS